MATQEFIHIPEYWQQRSVRPRGYAEICNMVETHGRVTGIWMIEQWDAVTGYVQKRVIAKNAVTDTGGLALLKNTWNNTAPNSPSAVNAFTNILIDNVCATTTLATALVSGTNYNNLTVAALPVGSTLADATTLTIGYASGQTQNCLVSHSGGYSAGATSIAVTSTSGGQFQANANYAIGTNVVPQPSTSDNPATSYFTNTGVVKVYSGNNCTFNYSGTGISSRQVIITYTFTGGASNVGSYTEAWTANVNSGADTGNTASHLTNVPMSLGVNTNLSISISEKL